MAQTQTQAQIRNATRKLEIEKANKKSTVEAICEQCKGLKQQYGDFLKHPEYSPWGYANGLRNKQEGLQKEHMKVLFRDFPIYNSDSLIELIHYCYNKCKQNIKIGR